MLDVTKFCETFGQFDTPFILADKFVVYVQQNAVTCVSTEPYRGQNMSEGIWFLTVSGRLATKRQYDAEQDQTADAIKDCVSLLSSV